MPRRPAVRFRSFCILCFALSLFTLGVPPWSSGTAEARRTLLDYADASMQKGEPQIEALQRISGLKNPDEGQVAVFIVTHLRLAAEEREPQARAAHWRAVLDFLDARMENGDVMRVREEAVGMVELLSAMQEAPGNPLPAYRARIEAWLAAEQERLAALFTAKGKEVPGNLHPSYRNFATFHDAAEEMLGYAPVVPGDMLPVFYKTMAELLGELMLEAGNDSPLERRFLGMLLCVSRVSAGERGLLLDQMYGILQAAARQPAESGRRTKEPAAENAMGLTDLIRLLQASVPGFDLDRALHACSEEAIYSKGMDALLETGKMMVGDAAGSPDAEQRRLIDSATGHFRQSFGSGSAGYSYRAGPLSVLLNSMALTRFPNDARLKAGFVLTLYKAWDPAERRYTGYPFPRDSTSLPPLDELVAEAEKAAPDDLVVLSARFRTTYGEYEEQTGRPLAAKLLLQFKIGCLGSGADGPWHGWRTNNYYNRGVDTVDLQALFKDMDAFGGRCPSFNAFARYQLTAAAHRDNRDQAKEAAFRKEQTALLETALTSEHPGGAAVLLYGNLGDMAGPPYQNGSAPDAERLEALNRAIRWYELAYKTWAGERDGSGDGRSDKFPWAGSLGKIYDEIMKTPGAPLSPELLDKVRELMLADRWGGERDPWLSWADKLFALADDHALKQFPERAGMLRQKGFEAYSLVDPETLAERDWVTWAGRIKSKAAEEKRLADPAVIREVLDKLERALAFNPLGANSNEMISKLTLTLMAGTPEAEWEDLPSRAYGRFAVASGLPPAGARAFMIWTQSLHEAADALSDDDGGGAPSGESGAPGATRAETAGNEASIKAMRLLAERFDAAAAGDAREREVFLAALYPEAAAVPVRPMAFPERPAEDGKVGGHDVYAYRARLLPELIEADLASPGDFQAFVPLVRSKDDDGAYYHSAGKDTFSSVVLNMESFRLFPSAMARIETIMLDEGLPRELRLDWLSGMAPKLCESSLGVYYDAPDHRDCGRGENGVARAMAVWYAQPEKPDGGEERQTKDMSFAQRVEAADLLLSRFIEFAEEESPLHFIAEAQTSGRAHVKPWSNDYRKKSPWGIPYKAGRLGEIDLSWPAGRAGAALARHWLQEGFQERAEAILGSGRSLTTARLEAVNIIGGAPSESLDDALAAAPYSSGIASFTQCWGWMRNEFTYGVSPGGCDDNLLEVLQQKSLAGHRIVTADQQGPGISLRALDSPPASFAGYGSLYILFDGKGSLPKWLAPRVSGDYNAMAGTLLVGMDGPRLLPVDPGTSLGAALLNWVVTVGGPGNQAVIVASDDTPLSLAGRMAAWHLSLWEYKDGERSFVFNKPCGGSFLRAYLPQMKGEAASLFMGRERAIWFASPALGGVAWYRAEPEQGLQTLEGSQLPCTLELSYAQRVAGDGVFTEDAGLFMVNRLAFEKPKPGRDPAFAKGFYDRNMEALRTSAATQTMTWRERRRAVELLWKALGHPGEKEVRRILFAREGSTDMGKRISAAGEPMEEKRD